MKKKFSIIIATVIAIVSIAIPVCAQTSYLDVSAGDESSYYTYKDTGAAWENYYYVTPQTYVGPLIVARSSSEAAGCSSHFTIMHTYADKYAYGESSPGGFYYRLTAGPDYAGGPNWHLTGRYTP